MKGNNVSDDGGIAVIGMACVYPGAQSPAELWENVLAQRESFRKIPPQRLPGRDYVSSDAGELDCTYCDVAALLEGYMFDRIRFRVSGEAYRATDLSHWLALDVATRALEDAGFESGSGLPRETTGVIVGNTLTGELSRANLLRLRWPYVRRVVQEQLDSAGMSEESLGAFLRDLEARYKAPFAAMGEESLAGALSNTIAGRICNQYDLGGGGYTIDGACSSSLLAVTNGCNLLRSGELDVAVVGGVDVSLDPFELVGFSRVGALARGEMRVYDQHPTGFLPGEGCGFVVLMRAAQARAQSRRTLAVIRGWGVSSDGHGGLTRPEVRGQLRALQRAYALAGFGVESVGLFEGHGTGTPVGDAVELTALVTARAQSGRKVVPAAVGSVKALIGHTKAAAGIAGLIKTVMALRAQVRPASAGTRVPHGILKDASCQLQAPRVSQPWPGETPLRAGVSSFGFGGINTHIVLEGVAAPRDGSLSPRERVLGASYQDCELFLLGCSSMPELLELARQLQRRAAHLSRSDMADLASALARCSRCQATRAGIVAASPEQLHERVGILIRWLLEPFDNPRIDVRQGVFLGVAGREPRILFVFPGQASPVRLNGGIFERRFECVRELYASFALAALGPEDFRLTQIAQPAIVASEVACAELLEQLGVRAVASVGHSLGELSALQWAGSYTANQAVDMARQRGLIMSEVAEKEGAMAAIAASCGRVDELIAGRAGLWVSGMNGAEQTVVSGRSQPIDRLVEEARAQGLKAARLGVSHAFHSPMMRPAADAFANYLRTVSIGPVRGVIHSTITGRVIEGSEDLTGLLTEQLTAPVQFSDAFSRAAEHCDLALEVGPGRVLSTLVNAMGGIACVPIDFSGESLEGLWMALGTVFALGGDLDTDWLTQGRFTRAFALDRTQSFLSNPCSGAASSEFGPSQETNLVRVRSEPAASVRAECAGEARAPDTREALRTALAARVEIPLELIRDDTRLLSDLHLNSITASQIVIDVARSLGLGAPRSPLQFVDATVAQVVDALDQQSLLGSSVDTPHVQVAQGIKGWARPFERVWLEDAPRIEARPSAPGGSWTLIAPIESQHSRQIRAGLEKVCGCGVVLLLSEHAMLPDSAATLLAAARASLRLSGAERYVVLVQPGGGAAPFFRTLHLEVPGLTTCVVDAPIDADLSGRLATELSVARGYHEIRYASDERRLKPVLRYIELSRQEGRLPLDSTDVVLVTGGAKGIAAECCIALAERTGARLILMGRADEDSDPQALATLGRLRRLGIQVEYARADVEDSDAVRTAIQRATARLGPVTAVVHAAGNNRPTLLGSMDPETLLAPWRTKVIGLENVVSAVDARAVRLLVTFGSVIACSGMPGEAHYALANEGLTRAAQRLAAAHPHWRCVNIEWSLWSDLGMGVNIGSVERLSREGVAPITPDAGVRLFLDVLASAHRGPVLVTGRLPALATLQFFSREPAVLRYLESFAVHFPGVELIADASLRTVTDEYLNDHVFSGERLLPAVLGLEAMAQAAAALTGYEGPLSFTQLRFSHPVVVPDQDSTTVRTIAMTRDAVAGAAIDLALRSSRTEFQQDHFLGSLLREPRPVPALAPCASGRRSAVDWDASGLYGTLFFQGGRFRTVSRYRYLEARRCEFEVRRGGERPWFGSFLPGRLLLGDPAARDGALHGIQACVPHERLLPIGAEWVVISRPAQGQRQVVTAVEREHRGAVYTYDFDIQDDDGTLIESWRGLRLQCVGPIEHAQWSAPLLGVYLERVLERLLGVPRLCCAIASSSGDRVAARGAVLTALTGDAASVEHQWNGRPVLRNGATNVSLSHTHSLTFAVSGHAGVSCDIEGVAERPTHSWRDLLGPERFRLGASVAASLDESESAAATRVWCVSECIRKIGLPFDTPVTIHGTARDGWAVFQVGDHAVATLAARVESFSEPCVLAVLAGEARASV